MSGFVVRVLDLPRTVNPRPSIKEYAWAHKAFVKPRASEDPVRNLSGTIRGSQTLNSSLSPETLHEDFKELVQKQPWPQDILH